MERWLTGTTVVLVWGAFNTILVAILAGFTASGFVGGAGPGALAFSLYAISTTLVFLIALVVWAGKRRRAGLRVPRGPARRCCSRSRSAVSWLGLALGGWVAYLAIPPLAAAVVLELYPREHP